jgi:predicted transcriptional regulator
MSKLDKLPVKKEVIHQLAIGESQTSIAEQVGVDQSTVSRFANKDEAIKAIEEEKLKLAETVPDAVENVRDLVKEMKDIPKDDIKRRELSYKASKDVLKAANVFPSPQYAHNIYNDNRQQVNITPEYQEFIDFKSNNGEPVSETEAEWKESVNQIPS